MNCNEDNFLFLCCQKFGNDNNRILEQRFVHKVIENSTFVVQYIHLFNNYNFFAFLSSMLR